MQHIFILSYTLSKNCVAEKQKNILGKLDTEKEEDTLDNERYTQGKALEWIHYPLILTKPKSTNLRRQYRANS